jgi:MFS family permease
MLLALLLVCAGSAICGAAANMPVLIAGRGTCIVLSCRSMLLFNLSIPAIQGFGGGGVTAATVIIVADMVSLRERGMFEGYLSMCEACLFALASLITCV